MDDTEIAKYLTKIERWAYQRAVRQQADEVAATTNPDGSVRVTYVAGPWAITVTALRDLSAARRACAGALPVCRAALEMIPCLGEIEERAIRTAIGRMEGTLGPLHG